MRMSAFSPRKQRVSVVVVLVVMTVTFHLIVVLYIVGNGCVKLGGGLSNLDQEQLSLRQQLLQHSSQMKSSKSRKTSRSWSVFNLAHDYGKGHPEVDKSVKEEIQTNHVNKNELPIAHPTFSSKIDGKHKRLKDRAELENTSSTRMRGPSFTYNCSTISTLKLSHPIGRGISKQTFVGETEGGVKVAVKMVTRHVQGMKECLQKYGAKPVPKNHKGYSHFRYNNDNDNNVESIGNSNSDTFSVNSKRMKDYSESSSDEAIHSMLKSQRENSEVISKWKSLRYRNCYLPATSKLMREIMMSQQLSHPNLASLLGFCVRNKETDGIDLSLHGVVAIYQLGYRLHMDSLQILPWQERLQHAIEMADLLTYLEFSPLGSLGVPDMKEGHLIKVNDKLKLIDLDDVTNIEPDCLDEEHSQRHRVNDCKLDIECIGNSCEGFNARKNLRTFNALLFKRLLFPLTFPELVINRVGQVNARLDSLVITAQQLKSELLEIRQSLGDHDDV